MKTQRRIYVFGSNEQGIHGSGTAKIARQKYGAQLGIGRGLTGNSYAIPTKHTPYLTRPLSEIAVDIKVFLEFARQYPDWDFDVVRIGCGLAGYKDHQIAPLFRDAPSNCHFAESWKEYLA